jgi:3-O-methylgallate 3,4-dioxygenase
MLSTPPEMWHLMGKEDARASYLVDPETGEPTDYADLLARRGDKPHPVDENLFRKQWEACQQSLATLSEAIRETRPDVLVIVSADQRELLFEDLMPMLEIYWGESIRMVPRHIPPNAPEVVRVWNWGYGDVELDLPVDVNLGRHLIEHLVEAEIDVSHSRYLHSDLMYGGDVGPAGYLKSKNVTPYKRQGIGHGWGFVVKRLLDNRPIPMVPILQNATFPPNMPTPKRCYKVGQAIREGIEQWESEKRVCVIASGGLSHFVTDEVVDGMLIDGILKGRPADVLPKLPRERLNSASAEIRSWITVAATCEHMQPNLINYVPVYRSAGGTGGGWAFMQWR